MQGEFSIIRFVSCIIYPTLIYNFNQEKNILNISIHVDGINDSIWTIQSQ